MATGTTIRREASVTTGDITGDLNVDITPPTAGVEKSAYDERNTDTVIPAGAYELEVTNIDALAMGGTITVNGDPVPFQGTWRRMVKEDKVNNVQDFVSQTNIVSNGLLFRFTVSYPSSSAVDPSTI